MIRKDNGGLNEAQVLNMPDVQSALKKTGAKAVKVYELETETFQGKNDKHPRMHVLTQTKIGEISLEA